MSTILLSNDFVNEMRRANTTAIRPTNEQKLDHMRQCMVQRGNLQELIFSRDLNESTARRLKTEYLQKLKERKRQSGKTPAVTVTPQFANIKFVNLLSSGYSLT